jgi:hypothetical protein
MTNIDTVQETGHPPGGRPTDRHDPVPAVADWLIGLLTGVIGLVLTGIGVGLYTQVDKGRITETVTEEGVEVTGLTQSEVITAAGQFVDWVALGVILTGLVSVAGAGAFIILRRRTRRRVAQEGGTTATFWACAVYGAVVTALVSFIPGSAIVGGGAAAYLHDGDSSVRTGAAAGVVGTILTIPLVAFLAIGFIAGGGAVGELADGALLAAMILGAELVALMVNVGAGALGGFLFARFV